MGRDPPRRQFVHFFGANLHFDGHAVHAYDHRVEGLIAVDLGNGDVILEFPRHGFVQIVNRPEGAITGIHVLHYDAEGVNIHDLVEGFVLAAHLVVDAVEVLLAADHQRAYIFALQARLYGRLDIFHQRLAVAAHALERRL